MTVSHDPVWVFGYGSLIWRPSLPFVDRRAARITGWARRFWQQSTDHRGTPDHPGRVLTLIDAPGATLWGMAYAVDAAVWPEVFAALEVREQQGYDRIEIVAHLAADGRAGPTIADVRAIMYLATTSNPHFIGPEPLDRTAAIVRASRGPSGDNTAYVHELAAALAALGAEDPDVDALARLL